MYHAFSFYNGELGFYIRSIGHFDYAPGEMGRRKTVDFGEIFWCISGSGYFHDHEGKTHILQPNWVWYYPPGSTHIFGAASEHFHYRWLTIDGPLAAHLFAGFNIAPGMTFAGLCPEEYFERIASAISDPSRMPDMLCNAVSILSKINSGTGKNVTSGGSIAAAARALIDQHFRDAKLNVEYIADKLGRHRVSVARDFKLMYGISISSYIQSCRYQEAFYLIRETKLPLAEIPARCGFSSINYLSRVIRTTTGITPGELRRSGK
ncbi:MAG: helix-turn-helix transcriptional regulator [Lentisphaeria bacterium]|nr:helix-turn-helix transcriptional regulator [Lentisphaeria bacterium]